MAATMSTRAGISYMDLVTTMSMNWTMKDNSSTGSGKTCSVDVSTAREEMEVIRSVGWGMAALVTLITELILCKNRHAILRTCRMGITVLVTLTVLSFNLQSSSSSFTAGSGLEGEHPMVSGVCSLPMIRSVGWGIAVLVTLTILSCATIAMFLHSWIRIRRRIPYGNRRVFLVRLFGLFPVFSGTSLAGFYVPKASLIANWGASLYLSTTLYTFVLLIVDYYGGVEPMEDHLEGVKVSLSAPPLTCCCPCLPKINFTMTNFHRLRRLVLQTAYIRPLCVFIAAVLWADGLYKPSIIEADSAYVYLSGFSLISSLLAVYGLSVIYNATHNQLEHFMISVKFASMKCVLIITNGQNLLIAILIANDVIPCVGLLDSASRGELLYNMLVIFEMFLLTFGFKFYYWRWMVKHEYGHRFASASVGDIADLEEKITMNVTHERITDLQESNSANGSLSNISKTGSFKSETVV